MKKRCFFVTRTVTGAFVLAAALAAAQAVTAQVNQTQVLVDAQPLFQIGFSEVDLSGLTAGDLYEMADGCGGGLAIADFDDDGDLDIFLPNIEGLPDRLLQNNSGVFTDIAAAVGVDGVPNSGNLADKPRSRGALWVDADGDRRLDLLVVGDCYWCQVTTSGTQVTTVDPVAQSWSKPRLFHQRPDGSFEDGTAASGLALFDFLQDCPACGLGGNMFRHLGGLAAGDVNGDELPDLFVGHWTGTNPGSNRPHNGRILLSNAATGVFTDADQLIGQPGVPASMDNLGHHWQSVFHDWNGDGLQDVLNALDGDSNTLWLNQGGQPLVPFVDDAQNAGLAHGTGVGGQGSGGFDMGIGVGDYNNDGFFDVYFTTTNGFSWTVDQLLRAEPGLAPTALGTPVYSDQIAGAGIKPFVEPTGPQAGQSWGWGVTWLDANLDGWLDLAITNGFSSPPGFFPQPWLAQATDSSLLFINNLPRGGFFGIPVFSNQSQAWNFNDTFWGSGLGALDFDRNGTLDLAQTTQKTYPPDVIQPSNFRLLRNKFKSFEQEKPHWLVIRPRLTTANTHAIGAVVRVTYTPYDAPATLHSRLITAGISFMTQEPAEAHFGFGPERPMSVKVRIEWPDGRPDSTFAVSQLDRVITYGWCNQMDLASPYGVLDNADVNQWLALWIAGNLRVDFAAPFGVLDNADITAASNIFAGGCPTATIPATDLP